MCSGDRLVADFIAGTDARPGLPEELDEHLSVAMRKSPHVAKSKSPLVAS
jgi:hypothetical protein